jgi:hypothetical protein
MPATEEKKMMLLKGCPRCRGDLHIGPDQEPYCLQCGYEANLAEKEMILKRVARLREQSKLAQAA